MHFKIAQYELKIDDHQAQYLDETLRMQLGRYTPVIDLVTVNFKKDKDQFGQAVIHCGIEIDFYSQEKMTASNTATTIEKSLYNAVSRAKRQLDRQRRANTRQSNPPYISK
ncbi:hypothetical protein ISG33_04435 [Glaciecola sp. MH2013]|uniref:HPF/RaiA family ribosome-associated protein n=1 Tax=Glaciecola sp. MH2013 TaxID=2785524 RepID=UPI00189E764E|nr:HPF/RaiA family ribosome-associated protein [Glaciecola sp. MH2013]MBF7072644.1 hypothetical protein [Glaciecola sp. MH2013]